MNKLLMTAALMLCVSCPLALANGDGPPPPPEVTQEAPPAPPQTAEAPQPQICPSAVHKPRKKVRHVCKPKPRPARVAGPPVVQKLEPIVNVQRIIERTEVQRVVVNRPTIVIQSPPTIVRSPCVQGCPRSAVVQPCGPRPCPPAGVTGMQQGQQHVAAARPTVDCAAMGGTRTINPHTGRPSCFVPNR